MEMIIGGAYQGKSSYAEKQFPDVKWKCGAELTEEELLEAEGVLGFHQYIRKCLNQVRICPVLQKNLRRKIRV